MTESLNFGQDDVHKVDYSETLTICENKRTRPSGMASLTWNTR